MKVNQKQNFLKGLIKENPVFVYVLGICSILAVTKTLESGIGMSMAVIFVLFFSNVVIVIRIWFTTTVFRCILLSLPSFRLWN